MEDSLHEHRSGQLLALMPEPEAQLLAETLVAFANSDGGTIIIGVDETGRATGQAYADEVEVALRAAMGECRPLVEARWHQAAAEEGLAFAIVVTRSPELHSLADGRVLVRAGEENRPLSGGQIRQLAATKSIGDLEAEPAPGARREDFDDEVIAEFVTKWEERQRREWTRSIDDLLLDVGAVDEDGRPTVGGVLLFARNPQAFLPQSGLTFVKFVGKLPRGEAGQPGYGRREEIGGPLARSSPGLNGRNAPSTRSQPCVRHWSTPWHTGTTGWAGGASRCACSPTVWRSRARADCLVSSLWTTSSRSTFRATRASSLVCINGATSRNWGWAWI